MRGIGDGEGKAVLVDEADYLMPYLFEQLGFVSGIGDGDFELVISYPIVEFYCCIPPIENFCLGLVVIVSPTGGELLQGLEGFAALLPLVEQGGNDELV